MTLKRVLVPSGLYDPVDGNSRLLCLLQKFIYQATVGKRKTQRFGNTALYRFGEHGILQYKSGLDIATSPRSILSLEAFHHQVKRSVRRGTKDQQTLRYATFCILLGEGIDLFT